MSDSPYVAPRPGDIDYDTEFLHMDGVTYPISIGLVRWDGSTYYAIDESLPWDTITELDPWVANNVLAKLPQAPGGRLDLSHPDVKPREQVREELLEFAAPAVEHGLRLWAAAGGYDHTVLGMLMGRGLMNWPSHLGWPYFTDDLYEELRRLGLTPEDLPKQGDGEHHPLEDARHLRSQRWWVARHARQRERGIRYVWNAYGDGRLRDTSGRASCATPDCGREIVFGQRGLDARQALYLRDHSRHRWPAPRRNPLARGI
ncbi:3'-5' exoribonuclease domain-containing protein [Streptomyces xiamenensis]|uniref:3'-5' exoribonuclease domain-containing protein n=1 Tax=Streptomyces xiamenensis TaxID=408015 RepID=UPI0035E246B6